jgi:hypothetical protein
VPELKAKIREIIFFERHAFPVNENKQEFPISSMLDTS